MKILDETQQAMTPNEVINNIKTLSKNNGILIKKEQFPSRGIFYNQDIYVTPFTGMDLKDISNIEEANTNQVLYKILSRRVSGISINDILVGDKLWLIYFIRDITYKQMPLKIKDTCPACGKQSVFNYTFDKLVINYYDKHLPNKQIKLPNEDLAEFTFPTIAVESQINRLKNDPNMLESIDDQFMLLASYIKTVNGKKLSLWDAYNYAKGVDAPTFCKIIHMLDKYTFNFPRTAKFTCECGEEVEIPIQLTQNFLIPDFDEFDEDEE